MFNQSSLGRGSTKLLAVLFGASLVGAACSSDSELSQPGDELAFAESGISVVCDANGVDVTTTRHDISNVVVEQTNGDVTKYDSLKGKSYRVNLADVETVWVKSGNNDSGDGPGFGERFSCSDSGTGEGAGGEGAAVGDDGTDEEAGGDDGAKEGGGKKGKNGGDDGDDAAAGGDDMAGMPIQVWCDEAGVSVQTTEHAISNVVVEQTNGERTKFEDMNGMMYRVDMPNIVAVWVKAGDNDSGDGPGYGEKFPCSGAGGDGEPAMEDPAEDPTEQQDPAMEEPAAEEPAGDDPAAEEPAGDDAPPAEDPAAEDPAAEDDGIQVSG